MIVREPILPLYDISVVLYPKAGLFLPVVPAKREIRKLAHALVRLRLSSPRPAATVMIEW